MVPLQARRVVSLGAPGIEERSGCRKLTELLLDNLQNLLLIEFLGKTLDRGQGLATIALCMERYQSVIVFRVQGGQTRPREPRTINAERQCNVR